MGTQSSPWDSYGLSSITSRQEIHIQCYSRKKQSFVVLINIRIDNQVLSGCEQTPWIRDLFLFSFFKNIPEIYVIRTLICNLGCMLLAKFPLSFFIRIKILLLAREFFFPIVKENQMDIKEHQKKQVLKRNNYQ